MNKMYATDLTINRTTRRFASCSSDSVPRLGPVLLTLLITLAGSTALQAEESDPENLFRLGVGDSLAVSVWKSPDLTTEIQIRPDGRIGLPLIGEVEAAGKTTLELQEMLTEKLKQFVTSPAVSVVVTEINSRKIFVVGEIQSSGEYDLLRPTTLMQAIAKAGGFTEYADKDSIVILRQNSRLTVSFKKIVSGRDPGDNILLEPDDTIVVP